MSSCVLLSRFVPFTFHDMSALRLRSLPALRLPQDSEGRQVASPPNTDIRARSGDWGRAPMCIALCSCVQRFWETLCSTLFDTVTASRSSSAAEAIWKPFWHVVEPFQASRRHLPEQIRTIPHLHGKVISQRPLYKFRASWDGDGHVSAWPSVSKR